MITERNTAKPNIEAYRKHEQDSSHSIRLECLLKTCHKAPINSHLLPLSILKKIENKSAKVMVSARAVGTDELAFTRIVPSYSVDASSFPGYCASHDTELYKEIENTPPSVKKYRHIFLLMHKVISKHYSDAITMRYFWEQINDDEKLARKIYPGQSIDELQVSCYLSLGRMRNLVPRYEALFNLFESQRLNVENNFLIWKIFSFEEIDVNCMSLKSGSVDFNFITQHTDLSETIDIFIFALPFKEGEKVVMASFCGSGMGSKYVKRAFNDTARRMRENSGYQISKMILRSVRTDYVFSPERWAMFSDMKKEAISNYRTACFTKNYVKQNIYEENIDFFR